ncbi:MAG: GAF domain-containing protein, partial [Chloroflexi bacterium]
MRQTEAALFERGAWTKVLEKYASVTHLTIQLYDTDERLICGPVHPTALFELFTPGHHDLGIFAACLRRCLTRADMPPAVVVEDHDGLAVVGTALMLSGEIVGVAVGGYALTTFLDQHAFERLARNSGRSFEMVWAVGRKERPLPRERLALYGELLRTLGDTLLGETFSTQRQEQTSTRLAEALGSEQAARAEAESAATLVRRVQALTDMALDLPLDDLLRELLTRVRNELQTDTAVILLRQLAEEGGEELRVRAALGLEEAEQRQARVPVGQGFAGRIAAERRPVVVEDVDHYQVVSRYIRDKGLHSLAGVPLQIDGRLIGVLHVGSMRPRKFQQQEVELLRLAGDRIALAIERTEVRAAAAAAAEAVDRAKDEFLATLSHELRSPLAAILTWVHLLRRGKLDATKTALALETIERSGKAQKHLIEDLLDVSRVVAGKLRIDAQPVELAEVIEAAVNVVGPAAGAKSVELESMLRGFR